MNLSYPVVPAGTSLARFRLKWNAQINWRSTFLRLRSLRFHAAIIFRMENVSKLFTVVVSTDQTTAALLVIVTIPLTLNTGVTGSAASACSIHIRIPPLTSWRKIHNV